MPAPAAPSRENYDTLSFGGSHGPCQSSQQMPPLLSRIVGALQQVKARFTRDGRFRGGQRMPPSSSVNYHARCRRRAFQAIDCRGSARRRKQAAS